MTTTGKRERKYGLVTKMTKDKAALNLAFDQANKHSEGQQHLGCLWEEAQSFIAKRSRTDALQRGGSIVHEARLHLERISLEEKELPAWPTRSPQTPEDELEKKLRHEWLLRQLERLPDLQRLVVENIFGMEHNPATLTVIARRINVSVDYVRQILDKTMTSLQKAWVADLRDANLILQYGSNPCIPPPVPSSAPLPAKPIGKNKSRKTTRDPYSAARCRDGVIFVNGILIRRIGNEAYAIDGKGPVGPADVAEKINSAIGNDNAQRLRRRVWMAKYDTDIADEMKALVDGPTWPTPLLNRRTLPLRILPPPQSGD